MSTIEQVLRMPPVSRYAFAMCATKCMGAPVTFELQCIKMHLGKKVNDTKGHVYGKFDCAYLNIDASCNICAKVLSSKVIR